MTILTLVLFFIPAALGISVAAALKAATEKIELVLIGTIGGLAAIVSLTYALTLAIPLSSLLLTDILLAASVTTVLILLLTSAWQNLRRLSLDSAALVSLIILVILFTIIASKLLFLTNGELKTGIINAYGDIGWHVANITMFAEGQSFPPENPILAGTRLTYPFMVNFFSAMLQISNDSINYAIVLPAIVLIPLLLTLIYCFVKNLTHRRSAAVVALLLFLLGGATLGWTRIYDDFQQAGTSPWEFLSHLPARDYSGVGNDQEGFHFLNPTFTLLLPQRPFLFGIPLAISILLLLIPANKNHATKARFIMAGVLAGLLPLFHAHTVLALIPAIIALFIINPRWPWGRFTATAIILGAPAIIYYMTGSSEAGSFFRWGPGWLVGDENIIWYWIKNTGLFIPAIALGFYLPAPRLSKALAAAGLAIFIIANLFLFAPWAWDNFKLFIYWFIINYTDFECS